MSSPNCLAPLRPRALTGEKGAGGMRGATVCKAVWLFSRRLDVGFVQRFVPIRGRDFDKKASQRLEASIISL